MFYLLPLIFCIVGGVLLMIQGGNYAALGAIMTVMSFIPVVNWILLLTAFLAAGIKGIIASRKKE